MTVIKLQCYFHLPFLKGDFNQLNSLTVQVFVRCRNQRHGTFESCINAAYVTAVHTCNNTACFFKYQHPCCEIKTSRWCGYQEKVNCTICHYSKVKGYCPETPHLPR